MFSTTYSSNILNAMFNTSKKTANNTVSFPLTPYLALFITTPNDSGTGAVEVSGSGYARINLTNSGAYNQQMIGTAKTASVSFSGTTVTVTPSATATYARQFYITATDGADTEQILVTIAANAASGTASATTLSSITAAYFATGETVVSFVDNQDLITFPENTVGGTNWGTITGFGIYDAATAGNLMFYGSLTAPATVTAGEIPLFRQGTFQVILR